MLDLEKNVLQLLYHWVLFGTQFLPLCFQSEGQKIETSKLEITTAVDPWLWVGRSTTHTHHTSEMLATSLRIVHLNWPADR